MGPVTILRLPLHFQYYSLYDKENCAIAKVQLVNGPSGLFTLREFQIDIFLISQCELSIEFNGNHLLVTSLSQSESMSSKPLIADNEVKGT